MNPEAALRLAQLVLGLHMLVALFVIFGMVAIPLGAIRGWLFVYGFGWRLAHFAAAAIIALQKFFGATCFLSIWEFDLLNKAVQAKMQVSPLHALAIDVMHWNMPLWFFTALYAVVFAYIAMLWWRVRPGNRFALDSKLGS